MERIPQQELPSPPQKPIAHLKQTPIYWGSPPIYLKGVLSLTVENIGDNDCQLAVNELYDYVTLSSGDSVSIDLSGSGASIERIHAFTSQGLRTTLRLTVERYVPDWRRYPKPRPRGYHWTELYKEW